MTKEEEESTKEFIADIAKDAKKKVKSKTEKREIMFGLGFFGLVGWSIDIPTLLSIALGVFLDQKLQSNFSWTLTLIFVGIIVGSFNAWRWVSSRTKDETKRDEEV